jgi:hypothetical protein
MRDAARERRRTWKRAAARTIQEGANAGTQDDVAWIRSYVLEERV